jgi:hypothetical protein
MICCRVGVNTAVRPIVSYDRVLRESCTNNWDHYAADELGLTAM